MQAPHWPDVKRLFEAALQEAPAAREALVRASALPAEVQEEVLSLLAHATGGAADQADFLAAPAACVGPERAGLRLGAWQLQSLLGSGGMGEVWLARRVDGTFEGEAAVKLLKPGMDSSAVLQRFALERQALARLEHPHIARLLDAGLSPDGLPYFVMERVRGRPIDQACQGLALEQRLALFLQLADAVAHAHRHLLVHRDLKPGNVLVNEQGQVKLLDFGIAKALDPLEATGATPTTQLGDRPLTPAYASPEQVRGEPVSTATDLYSLGVLLYVMLTGQRPYGRSASSPAEAARSVLEDPPSRPSSLSADSPAEAAWWQQHRRRLRGDLDNILLKTLEKDPVRRYASVEALQADIRAHLAGYPVSARAPALGYLASRFVRRNPWAVAMSSLALLGVLGGGALALWQARVAQDHARQAEARFQELHRFARTMLVDVDTALREGPTPGREKLVQTALAYLDRLSQERLDDTALLRDVAEGYERVGEILGGQQAANLGRPQDAQASLAKALALRQQLMRLAPQDQKNLAGLKSIHERLGDADRARGELRAAHAHYEQAARHAAALSQARPDDLALQLKRIEADRFLASVRYLPFQDSLGDYAPARASIEALDREMRGLLERFPERPEVLEAAGGLVNQLIDFQRLAGDYALALETARRSEALASRLLAQGPDKPRARRWMYLAEGRLADALLDSGDIEAGLALWRRSIERREQVAQADPANERAWRNVANGYGPLGEQLDSLQRPAQALSWYEKELQLLRRLVKEHPQVQALKSRLEESMRDNALQLSLGGHHVQARALMASLRQQRGSRKVEDPDEARFALVAARVGLAGPGPRPPDADVLLQEARQGLALVRDTSRREPFNALMAREAALAAWWLADLEPSGTSGCALKREALQGLLALERAGRLPQAFRGWRLPAPCLAA